jgi:hypothetical protein
MNVASAHLLSAVSYENPFNASFVIKVVVKSASGLLSRQGLFHLVCFVVPI